MEELIPLLNAQNQVPSMQTVSIFWRFVKNTLTFFKVKFCSLSIALYVCCVVGKFVSS